MIELDLFDSKDGVHNCVDSVDICKIVVVQDELSEHLAEYMHLTKDYLPMQICQLSQAN